MKICYALLLGVLLTACQSTPTSVIARADHSYEVSGYGKTKAIATTQAMMLAKRQCAFRQPIVINDQIRYRGVVDERIDRLIDKGVQMVEVITGQNNLSLAKDDDYEHSVSFRCR